MALFLDTSALVKLYVPEAGSAEVERLADADPVIHVGSLAEHEFLSAILRRVRLSQMSSSEASTSLEEFRGWLLARANTVQFGPPVSDRARDLLERHHFAGLRLLDAIQLACCLAVPGAEMVLADRALARVAEAEGVVTRIVG